MKQTIVLLAVGLLLAGCTEKKSVNDVDYVGFRSEEGGNWGMISLDGKVLFEDKYEGQVTSVIGGCFSVYVGDRDFDLYTAGEKPHKIGNYKDVGSFTSELCPVVGKNGYIKYIDTEGNTAFDLKKVGGKEVTHAFGFFDDRALICVENNLWGFVDKEGNEVIKCKWADAWNFNEGLAIVQMDKDGEVDYEDKKWGVIDRDGKLLFSKHYKDMEPYSFRYSEGLLVVQMTESGKLALLDEEGKTVKKLKTTYAGTIYDGMFIFSEDEHYGLMNTNGEVVLRAKYTSLSYNGKFLAGSLDGEKFYLLKKDGEKIAKLDGSPMLFEPEYVGYDKYLAVYDEDNSSYTLVDNEGNEVKTDVDIKEFASFYYWSVTSDAQYNGDYSDNEEYIEDYEEEEYE